VRALKTLAKRMRPWLEEIHARRVGAVFAVVAALLRGGRLPLSALGRAVATHSKVKHGIKRVDRLLGNDAIVPAVFYRAISSQVVKVARPIILVDWSEAGDGLCMLAAAVPLAGRALVVYSETHPERRLSSPRVESAFLLALRTVLPSECRPIIVTDAGFRRPFFLRVRKLGWDFVGRIRNAVMLRASSDEPWRRSSTLFGRARRKPQDLGRWQIVRRNSHEARIVTVDGRSPRARRPPRNVARRIPAKRAAKLAREPWVLVTSLAPNECTAAEIVSIYKQRMLIEEAFRDEKSHRFGWSFEDCRTRSTARVDKYILIATLATLVAILVGLAVESIGRHRDYQANTVHHRRVLSLVTLGRIALSRSSPAYLLPLRLLA
jgi:hypothetical protein